MHMRLGRCMCCTWYFSHHWPTTLPTVCQYKSYIMPPVSRASINRFRPNAPRALCVVRVRTADAVRSSRKARWVLICFQNDFAFCQESALKNAINTNYTFDFGVGHGSVRVVIIFLLCNDEFHTFFVFTCLV